MKSDFAEELSVAVALAEKAAIAVMAARGTATVTKKAGGEPVTTADLEANRIILEGLKRSFPRDAILSEETPSDPIRSESERVWIIDPIDGTREFIDGTDDFAIQIGLAIGGVPVVGIVYQVAKRRLYLASAGGGAWLEDPQTPGRARRRMKTRSERDISKMSLTVSRWHLSKKGEAMIKELKPAKLIPAGSIGVKMGLVSLGEVDLYLHPSSKCAEWDTCAPAVILLEAGGVVSDFLGEPLRYNQPDPHHPLGVAASSGAAHEQVLARIAPVLRDLKFLPPL